MRGLAAAGLFVCASLTTAANAAILFQHPFVLGDGSGGWCSSCVGEFREWDAFDLAFAANVTEIDARLAFTSDPALETDLQYSVWDSTRTTQLFSESFTAAGLTIISLGGPNYDVFAPIAGLTLNAGTYYLSIYDPLPPDQSSVAWYNTNVTVDGRSRQSLGAAPLPLAGGGTGLDLAFRIIGVPEPGTLLLLALGLIALGTLRCRSF